MYNTSSPLMQLQNEMNRLFEDYFEEAPGTRPFAGGYPTVNVWEDGDAAWLEAELPGMNMNDIEIFVTANEVTINGNRNLPEQPQASWHRRERLQGRFTRMLTLPWEVNADKVEARFQDGVLTVKLPKSEASKPKKIAVQGA